MAAFFQPVNAINANKADDSNSGTGDRLSVESMGTTKLTATSLAALEAIKQKHGKFFIDAALRRVMTVISEFTNTNGLMSMKMYHSQQFQNFA